MKKFFSVLLSCAAALIIGTSAASASEADEQPITQSLSDASEVSGSLSEPESASEADSYAADISPAGIVTALAPAALAIVLAAAAAIVSRSRKRNDHDPKQ